MKPSAAPHLTARRARRGAFAAVLPILLALAASQAAAFDEGAAPGGPAFAEGPGGPGGPPPGPAEEEDLAETLEIYMVAKMKRALALSREQEEKVVPLIQELSEARRGFTRERRWTLMAIRPLVEDPNSREEEIRTLLDRLGRNETTFRNEESRIQGQIRSVLTPRQQAQFLFFQDRFRMEIQERLRRFREGNGPGGPRRHKSGAPADVP